MPEVQRHLLEVDGAFNSLQKVLPVCSTLQFPCPAVDTALTLTVYSVPASNPVRIVEVTRDETEMAVALSQDVVPLPLYSTWYWEMVRSLWGVVQVTLRAGAWNSTVLVNVTSLTLEGAARKVNAPSFIGIFVMRYGAQVMYIYIL